MLSGNKIQDESLCVYSESKEHKKLLGVSMQHDKNKALFKREVFSISTSEVQAA